MDLGFRIGYLLKASGVSQEIAAQLEAEKEKEARKAAKATKVEDKRPVLKKIESSRGFIQRAEKRNVKSENGAACPPVRGSIM